MRGFIILVVWLAVAVLPVPALAQVQDTEALRRELEQLRRQQEQYQKTIEALSERLKRLELQTKPATVPAAGDGSAPRRDSAAGRRSAAGRGSADAARSCRAGAG